MSIAMDPLIHGIFLQYKRRLEKCFSFVFFLIIFLYLLVVTTHTPEEEEVRTGPMRASTKRWKLPHIAGVKCIAGAAGELSG